MHGWQPSYRRRRWACSRCWCSSRTYHLYDCAETFCQSVSALTEERIKEIAANWRVIYGRVTPPTAAADAQTQLPSALTPLVELARTAVVDGARLRLRVDYRGKNAK